MAACVTCTGEIQQKPTRRTHRYVESGLSFVVLKSVIYYSCAGCGDSPQLPDARALSLAIAEEMIRRPVRFAADAVRFLRKALRMTSDEFAGLLGTTRNEVSRWENGHARMSDQFDSRLRLEVLDKLLPPRNDRRELRDAILDALRNRSADTEGADLVIDATTFYPRGRSRSGPSAKSVTGALTR